MKTSFKGVLRSCLFSTLTFAASVTYADNITLRVGAGHPATGFSYVQAVDTYFIPEVTKRAKAKGHNVTFIKAWAGSVAKLDGVIDAVSRGVLDIGLCLPTFEPGKADLFNFSFYAPFGPSDPRLMGRVGMRMLREAPGLQESMKAYNVRLLQLSSTETYGVMSTVKMDGLQSMKARKLGLSPANANLFAAAGATPVTVPTPEAYMALKNGMIEGEVFYKSALDSFKLAEVTKHYLNTRMGSYIGIVMLINANSYAKLPTDLAAIVDEVAAETSAKTSDLNVQREAAGDEAAKKAGVEVVDLSDADRATWLSRIKDLPINQAKALDAKGLKGTETFATYFRILKQEGYSFPGAYTGF